MRGGNRPVRLVVGDVDYSWRAVKVENDKIAEHWKLCGHLKWGSLGLHVPLVLRI